MRPLLLTLLILAHLSGPPVAMAPMQDAYRVRVLEERLLRLQRLSEWAIRNGVKMNIDGTIWR